MAKNDQNNNTIKDNLDQFRTLSKLTTAEIYGTDENFHEENERDILDIKNVIKSLTKDYKKNTGENIIDFFNAVNFKSESKNNRSQKLENTKRQLMDIQNKMESPDLFNVTEIFSQETGRFQLYNSYHLIYENIPQMKQALDTYVDNIMSPDDFTKTTFNIVANGNSINGISDNENKDDKEIVDNCKRLIETYKLESESVKILRNALKLGDCFVAVLNYKDELSRIMLNENSDNFSMIQDPNKYILSENDVELSDIDVESLSELFNEDVKIPTQIPTRQQYLDSHKSNIVNNQRLNEEYNLLESVYNEEKTKFYDFKGKLKHDISEILNRNIIISEDSSVLLEQNKQYEYEFQGADLGDDFFTSKNHKDEVTNKSVFLNNKNHKVKAEELHVNGSIMKILKPERIVKLELEQKEFGYYYVENLDESPDYLTMGSYSINSNIFTNFRSQQNDKPDVLNTKYKLITDIFVKNISKKIDKKFINTHAEFKDLIYNLLRQDYLINHQIRIVYLKPNEVVHFGEGDDTYKDSIYKSILFQAKLYLAVLTSQVMLRLVRSPEKRAFYIETDLDNDTEAVVQSFIRDTKTKDIKMSNFGNDINTILNSVGTFNDYFIPVGVRIDLPVAALYSNI